VYQSPDDEIGWLWGVGLSYALTDRIDLDLAYRRHDDKAIEVETVGLELLFGF
jgi:opacity protein-like surface antigen